MLGVDTAENGPSEVDVHTLHHQRTGKGPSGRSRPASCRSGFARRRAAWLKRCPPEPAEGDAGNSLICVHVGETQTWRRFESCNTLEDLANFVTAFKEMASQLDEDGARNLLMWSPLFVPTVQGLMRPGARPRRAKPRLKASNPPELVHPAPSAADVATAAARDAHMAQLQRMYAAGGAGDAERVRRL